MTIAVAAAVAVVLAFTHHALAKFVISRAASAAAGYDIRFGDMALGWSHTTLTDLHVRKNGDPVLDAARVDIDYALRDVFPGGKHRFGFAGVAIDRPTVTLLRHADGSYNFTRGGTSSSPPPATQAAAEPLLFGVRVRDGTIRVIDEAPMEPDLAEQSIVNVNIDATVQSNARTSARVDGTLIGRRTQSSPIQRWPLSVRSVIDYQRGFAMHRFRAAQLPLRGLLNFLVHDKIARFDDGVMRDLDVKAYAIGIDAGTPFGYRLGGGGTLAGAQIDLGPLAKPVRDLHGTVDLFDDGVTSPDMRATAAGIPLRISGGMYDFSHLHFRLGIEADPQLAQLRQLFTFLRSQPLQGPMHIETLVTATVDNPLIRTVVSSPHIIYGTIPLDGAGGVVDYARGAVSFAGFHTGFGALQATLGGAIPVDKPNGILEGAIHIGGPASDVPYAQAIAAGETIGGDATIIGGGPAGFRARGMVAAEGPHGGGSGMIAVDERGVGEFGPFLFHRDDGSVLAGAFRLERPDAYAAGWAVANNYRIDVPAHVAVLPGVQLVGFPPIGGTVDAALVAGGPPSAFAIAGHVQMRDAGFEQYPLGSIAADLGGTFDAMWLHDIRLDGPRGRFRGNGAVENGIFAVRGGYDGSFADLTPFTGDIGGRGDIHAPVAALVDRRGVTVQTSGAVLPGGSIHGVALADASGTLLVAPAGVRIITGSATLDGAHAVVAARDAETAISMVGVPAAAFAGSGLPLNAGRLSLFGIGDLERPSFRGSIDLDNGRAMGYPIGGWVDIAFGGKTLSIRDGVAALGSTYGRLGGRIDGIGSSNFRYDLDAGIDLGDVGGLIRDLHVPVRYAEGSFAGRLQISGGASAPSIAGTVQAPEGSYNGLAFRDAAGRIAIRPGSAIRVEDGRVTVGSTRATFEASAGEGISLAVASPAVDLADFDDYFDPSDMLAGTGAMSFRFANDGRHTLTAGRIQLADARVRRFPLGAVNGRWASGPGGTIAADLTLIGPAGNVHTGGTIVPAAGGPLDALLRARYAADVTLAGLDLGTMLPAAGITYPILGRLTAGGRIAGVFPRLAIGGHASLAGGEIGPYPVLSADATTRIIGDSVSIDTADADLGFVRLTASGLVGLGASDPLALRIHASVPDLSEAARRVSPRKPIDVGGALESDVLIGGTRNAPRLEAGFDLDHPRYGPLLVQRIVGNIASDLHSVRLQSAQFVLNHGSASIAGELPIAFSPAGIGPASAPISITADAHNVDLSSLAPLLPGTGTKLTGVIDGHLVLEGTAGAPRVLGSVSLSQGSYVSNLETSPIREVSARLGFEGTSVALEALHARVGAGSLDADGRLDLPVAGLTDRGYAVGITAKNAQINVPAFGGATIDGSARLVSGARMPTLSGDVTLSNATIPFAAIFRAASGSSETPAGPPLDLAFDLHAKAKSLRIRSSIIDVGAAGDITLTGTLLAPRAAGQLTATRGGVFSTYQRLFRIQDATVTFDPSQGIVPNLDLHATAHVENPDPDPSRNAIGSADITVAVTGPADAYSISYSSSPQYSQAQIIALLVDLPLLGSLNFGPYQPAGTLRGAPGESDALLPPGVTPYKTSAAAPIQQEEFSLFNTQLTQRFLSPIENAIGDATGLTDLQLTLDYGGRVGVSARQQLSRKRAVYATASQILSYPTRTQIGFASQPDPATTISFTYFQQNGTPYYVNSIFGSTSTVVIQNGIQPLSDRQGFSFTVTRTYP